MNGFRALFASAAAAAALASALAAHGQPLILSPGMPPTKSQSPVTTEAIANARQPGAWPSFASVPAAPTDVRSLMAWKASVMTTRAAGAELSREAAAEPWTLHDSEAWASEERDAAAPPPPITAASSPADTEAYAAALRARATPPPRKR